MMIQHRFTIQTEKGPVCIKRIDKREARKRYYKGEDIYIEPCKLNPASKWLTHIIINILSGSGNFSTAVDNFEYYNCNKATGTYASFYVVDS